MQQYIFGNWKQNGDLALLRALIDCVGTGASLSSGATLAQVAIFPPFVYLSEAHQLLTNTNIALGAQDLSAHEKGAFTGEVGANMLREVGCQYVLIGHSERRHLFGESDQIIAEKFHQALQAGLTPVLCVGETLEEFEAGQTQEVLKHQVGWVEAKLKSNNRFLLAYEPVWAIGTGKAATAKQAQEVHQFIRSLIPNVPILYGGSAKPDNAAELLAMPDIDGLLIGGASLIPEQFAAIIKQ